MKIKKLVLFLAVILLVQAPIFAQDLLTGKVTRIIDGRTLILETTSNGSLPVQLQYIETPTDSALAQTVKEHLQKLLLNKTVSFHLKSVVQGKNTGKVINGELTSVCKC
jgi:endonuclease YncB( thermonuclease family)